MGPQNLPFNKFPGDADAVSLRITLWERLFERLGVTREVIKLNLSLVR